MILINFNYKDMLIGWIMRVRWALLSKKSVNVSLMKMQKIEIYGYTIVNDFTIRDWQFRGPPHTMTMGKSWVLIVPLDHVLSPQTKLLTLII